MNVTLNQLATGGYALNWMTRSPGHAGRHEDHITEPADIKAIALAFGWNPDYSKTYAEFLDMVVDDARQDIPNMIDVFDLPPKWKQKVLNTVPDMPDIFVFKNDDDKIWIGWTIKKADNHLVNHQYRLDTPEMLIDAAMGFGWEPENEQDAECLASADAYLRDYITEESDRDTGEPPEQPAVNFPESIHALIADNH